MTSPSSSGPNRAPALPTLGEVWKVEGALRAKRKKSKKQKASPAGMAMSPVPLSPVPGVCVTLSLWEHIRWGARLGAHPGPVLSLPLSPMETECTRRGVWFDCNPPQKGSSCTPVPALPPGKGTWPLPSLFCLGFYYFPFSESKNLPAPHPLHPSQLLHPCTSHTDMEHPPASH